MLFRNLIKTITLFDLVRNGIWIFLCLLVVYSNFWETNSGDVPFLILFILASLVPFFMGTMSLIELAKKLERSGSNIIQKIELQKDHSIRKISEWERVRTNHPLQEEWLYTQKKLQIQKINHKCLLPQKFAVLMKKNPFYSVNFRRREGLEDHKENKHILAKQI